MWLVKRGKDEETPEFTRDAWAFDAAIDALVSGQTLPRSGGEVMPVADAALAFHALDRRDQIPDPSAGFVERLEAALLGAVEQRSLAPSSAIVQSAERPRVAGSHRVFDRRRGHPVVAWVSTAAMIALTLTSVLVAFRWSDERNSPDDEDEVAVGGAGPATPSTTPCGTGPIEAAVKIVLHLRSDVGTVNSELVSRVRQILTRRAELLGATVCTVDADGIDGFVVRFAGPNAPDPATAAQALGATGLLEIVDTQGQTLLVGTIVRTSRGGPSLVNAVSGSIYETIVGGDDIEEAFITTNQTGQYAVGFTLNDGAAERLCDFTGDNISHSMAIALDKEVISTLVIQSPICGGQGIVEGLSLTEVRAAVVQLNTETLPVPLEVVSSQGWATPQPGATFELLTGPDIVDVSECTAQARGAGSVEALVGEPSTNARFLPGPTFYGDTTPIPEPTTLTPTEAEQLLGQATPADPATTQGIAVTARQLTACRFTLINPYDFPDDWQTLEPYADFNGAYFSLFSDDYFRRELIADLGTGDLPDLVTQYRSVGPVVPSVERVGLLPDGRALAVVGDHPFPYARYLMVFVHEDDRWLVDEFIVEVQDGLSADERQQLRDLAPQYLEVALHDDRARVTGPVDPDYKVVADLDLTVTIANLGTLPQRFEIPELGIRLEVPVGHSVAFVVNAPPGATILAAYRLNPDGSETRVLDGPLTFRPADTFCRFCG